MFEGSGREFIFFWMGLVLKTAMAGKWIENDVVGTKGEERRGKRCKAKRQSLMLDDEWPHFYKCRVPLDKSHLRNADWMPPLVSPVPLMSLMSLMSLMLIISLMSLMLL